MLVSFSSKYHNEIGDGWINDAFLSHRSEFRVGSELLCFSRAYLNSFAVSVGIKIQIERKRDVQERNKSLEEGKKNRPLQLLNFPET